MAKKSKRSLRDETEALMLGEHPTTLKQRLLVPLLALASPLYGLGVALNNRLFDWGIKKTHSAPDGTTVTSVGNITMGGAGKTPLVIALAQKAQKEGGRVGVLLRGYGSPAERSREPVIARTPEDILQPASHVGDEARLLSGALPGVAVIAGRDRVAAARIASVKFGCDNLILDDGFQHRRLARDLDTVILPNDLKPGAWRLFPRGYMREPISQLTRADELYVYLTQKDKTPKEALRRLPSNIQNNLPAGLKIKGMRRIAAGLHNTATGDEIPFPGKPWDVFWFAGIARPRRFVDTLKTNGANKKTLDGIAFPDHHPFDEKAITAIHDSYKAWKKREGIETGYLVTTQKDWVRIAAGGTDPLPDLHVVIDSIKIADD